MERLQTGQDRSSTSKVIRLNTVPAGQRYAMVMPSYFSRLSMLNAKKPSPHHHDMQGKTILAFRRIVLFFTPFASARGKRQGRRIVAYRHEKTKRCNIGNRVCTEARYPGNRPRHNTANKQFVDGLAFHELRVELHAVVSFVTRSAPVRALVSHVFPTAGNSDIAVSVSHQTAGYARCPAHIPAQ